MLKFGSMKGIFTFVFVFTLSLVGFGQDGSIEIIGNAELELLLDKKVASVDTTDLWGYRIQVYFGSERKDAQEKAAKLKMQFPELSTEIYKDYFQPNWRVRVGNYYHKIDAQKLMMKLEREFGDVFLVRDIIHLPTVY
ncbi:MAG: hypothetical protein ACI8SE_002029 [Bacteroidia bacterium]|jgi:hypothetical protein